MSDPMSDTSKRSHIERLVYVSPMTCPGDSITWGDWRDTEGPHTWYHDSYVRPGNALGRFVSLGVPCTIIELASGSDYSGNLVELSNMRCLQRDFPWLVELHGGYGTFGLAYLGRRENQNARLIEAIDALADYPLYSEDDHSELEHERAEQAWIDDGRNDFKRALVKMWALDDNEYDEDKLPDDAVDTLWRDCCELLRGGEEYLNEQGDSIYFPIDRVIDDIRRDWPDLYRVTYSYDDNRPIIEKLQTLRAIALTSEDDNV